ncbi:phage protease [Shinella sp. G-2]|uniref:phage protease n=1 Tax=Shinella sp. G-2 TaxID=3133141 RepID=UPI003CFD34A0
MKNALAHLATAVISAHVAELSPYAADGIWIQLIPAGTFNGRDGRGPYHAGDQASLQRIAELTRSYHGATDIVFDYEHQTLKAPDNGKPAPASGWIKEVEARADGLFGRVEWTAAAEASIRAREYRYLSPVFFHDKDGNVLALQNAALTNSPNLNMAEVSAHSVFHQTYKEEPMEKLIAALGLAGGASENDVLVAINSLLTSSTAIAVAAGLTRDAKSEAIIAAVQSAVADRKKIAIAVGKPETASADDIVSAISAAHSAGTVDPTKWVPVAQVTAMQAQLNALTDQIGTDKATEAVEKAIKEGKLVPALKEWGLSMHRADPAKFDEFIGKAPVLTAAQRSASAKDPSAAGDVLGDAELAVMHQMGLSEDDMKKSKAKLEAGR